MNEEEKQRLANELRRKSLREDMLDKFLGDRPEFGSFQDATRSLIDSDYNPEGTVLSRAMGITQQPAQSSQSNIKYGDKVENDNPYRDDLKYRNISEDRMPLRAIDILSDPIKSKDILINRLKELPLDVLAKMFGVR